MKENVPPGIKVLCLIYLLNVFLYFGSNILFYNLILIFNTQIYGFLAGFIRFILIFTPLYLYFRLKDLKKDAFFIALFFHGFFIINNTLRISENYGILHPCVKIVGIYTSLKDTPLTTFILVLNLGLNILIFGYLLKKKGVFE